jgi:hypothetical protein
MFDPQQRQNQRHPEGIRVLPEPQMRKARCFAAMAIPLKLLFIVDRCAFY